MNKTKILLVRLDDICETMNFANFKRMTNLLDKYNIKPLLGIVPDNKDKKLCVEVVNSGYKEIIDECISKGYSIAMHGVYHVYDSTSKGLVTNRPKSEFSGKSYITQFELLKYGMDVLQQKGFSTDIFFAPGHSYDRTTIKALRNVGIRIVSDGRSLSSYVRNGILFIPVRCFGTDIKPCKGITTLCFHTNTMSEHDFISFEAYIKKNLGMFCDFSEIKALKEANIIISIIQEKFICLYEFYIHPILRTIKQCLIKKRK